MSAALIEHNEKPGNKMRVLRAWIAHGYRCVLTEAPLWGAINGYVLVPNIKPGIAEQIEVHGGVTYEAGDWIGFDTLHSGDRWPDEDRYRAKHGMSHQRDAEWDRWWTEDDVAAETERMALSAKGLMEQ